MIRERTTINNKTEILAITLLVILFSLTGTALNFAFASANDVDLTKLTEIFKEGAMNNPRRIFRTIAAIHQIFTFVLPCFFFWWMIKRKEATDYFKISVHPTPKVLTFSFLFLIISLPFVGFSAWLNQLLPLPDWAINAEADTAKMIAALFSVDSPIEWMLNLLVIAAIPALGEELFFRGIVQTKLINYFKSPHVAIWLGAFFFSAFHFQFEGFFPRIVLGAVLGYLFYWSNNLWIPIILHFFNNAILVSAPYFAISDAVTTTDQEMGWKMIITVVGAGFIGYFLIKNRNLFFKNQYRLGIKKRLE